MFNSGTDRGQISPKVAVAMVVAVAVAGIISAFLVPIAVDELEGNTSDTITQDVNTTVAVNAELDSTLESTDAPNNTATYTLSSDNSSTTKTITVGNNATYSFDRGDVVLTLEDSQSSNATANFEYTKEFAYSDGARSLWGILGLALVLAVFLTILGIALNATNRI